MKYSKTYIAIPPGVTIKEMIDDRKMQQKELAIRLEVSEKHVSRLIAGKVELTTDMAYRLQCVLGMPAKFWLGLEADYRLDLKKVEEENLQDEEKELLKRLYYTALSKAGFVAETQNIADRIANLKSFFEVANLRTLFSEKFSRNVAFRKLKNTEKSDILALAWCQKAKIEARKQELGKLDIRSRLHAGLNDIRKLSGCEQPDITGIRKILNDCGIALVILPQLNGSGIHGASFAVGNSVVMGLTDRRKTADVFCFSLFHELGHVMREDFVRCGELTAEDEKAADDFARDQLLPPEDYAAFVRDGIFTGDRIRDFSSREGISPGIVVGRMQKDKYIEFSQFNDLKAEFSLSVPVADLPEISS